MSNKPRVNDVPHLSSIPQSTNTAMSSPQSSARATTPQGPSSPRIAITISNPSSPQHGNPHTSHAHPTLGTRDARDELPTSKGGGEKYPVNPIRPSPTSAGSPAGLSSAVMQTASQSTTPSHVSSQSALSSSPVLKPYGTHQPSQAQIHPITSAIGHNDDISSNTSHQQRDHGVLLPQNPSPSMASKHPDSKDPDGGDASSITSLVIRNNQLQALGQPLYVGDRVKLYAVSPYVNDPSIIKHGGYLGYMTYPPNPTPAHSAVDPASSMPSAGGDDFSHSESYQSTRPLQSKHHIISSSSSADVASSSTNPRQARPGMHDGTLDGVGALDGSNSRPGTGGEGDAPTSSLQHQFISLPPHDPTLSRYFRPQVFTLLSSNEAINQRAIQGKKEPILYGMTLVLVDQDGMVWNNTLKFRHRAASTIPSSSLSDSNHSPVAGTTMLPVDGTPLHQHDSLSSVQSGSTVLSAPHPGVSSSAATTTGGRQISTPSGAGSAGIPSTTTATTSTTFGRKPLKMSGSSTSLVSMDGSDQYQMQPTPVKPHGSSSKTITDTHQDGGPSSTQTTHVTALSSTTVKGILARSVRDTKGEIYLSFDSPGKSLSNVCIGDSVRIDIDDAHRQRKKYNQRLTLFRPDLEPGTLSKLKAKLLKRTSLPQTNNPSTTHPERSEDHDNERLQKELFSEAAYEHYSASDVAYQSGQMGNNSGGDHYPQQGNVQSLPLSTTSAVGGSTTTTAAGYPMTPVNSCDFPGGLLASNGKGKDISFVIHHAEQHLHRCFLIGCKPSTCGCHHPLGRNDFSFLGDRIPPLLASATSSSHGKVQPHASNPSNNTPSASSHQQHAQYHHSSTGEYADGHHGEQHGDESMSKSPSLALIPRTNIPIQQNAPPMVLGAPQQATRKRELIARGIRATRDKLFRRNQGIGTGEIGAAEYTQTQGGQPQPHPHGHDSTSRPGEELPPTGQQQEQPQPQKAMFIADVATLLKCGYCGCLNSFNVPGTDISATTPVFLNPALHEKFLIWLNSQPYELASEAELQQQQQQNTNNSNSKSQQMDESQHGQQHAQGQPLSQDVAGEVNSTSQQTSYPVNKPVDKSSSQDYDTTVVPHSPKQRSDTRAVEAEQDHPLPLPPPHDSKDSTQAMPTQVKESMIPRLKRTLSTKLRRSSSSSSSIAAFGPGPVSDHPESTLAAAPFPLSHNSQPRQQQGENETVSSQQSDHPTYASTQTSSPAASSMHSGLSTASHLSSSSFHLDANHPTAPTTTIAHHLTYTIPEHTAEDNDSDEDEDSDTVSSHYRHDHHMEPDDGGSTELGEGDTEDSSLDDGDGHRNGQPHHGYTTHQSNANTPIHSRPGASHISRSVDLYGANTNSSTKQRPRDEEARKQIPSPMAGAVVDNTSHDDNNYEQYGLHRDSSHLTLSEMMNMQPPDDLASPHESVVIDYDHRLTSPAPPYQTYSDVTSPYRGNMTTSTSSRSNTPVIGHNPPTMNLSRMNLSSTGSVDQFQASDTLDKKAYKEYIKQQKYLEKERTKQLEKLEKARRLEEKQREKELDKLRRRADRERKDNEKKRIKLVKQQSDLSIADAHHQQVDYRALFTSDAVTGSAQRQYRDHHSRSPHPNDDEQSSLPPYSIVTLKLYTGIVGYNPPQLSVFPQPLHTLNKAHPLVAGATLDTVKNDTGGPSSSSQQQQQKVICCNPHYVVENYFMSPPAEQQKQQQQRAGGLVTGGKPPLYPFPPNNPSGGSGVSSPHSPTGTATTTTTTTRQRQYSVSGSRDASTITETTTTTTTTTTVLSPPGGNSALSGNRPWFIRHKQDDSLGSLGSINMEHDNHEQTASYSDIIIDCEHCHRYSLFYRAASIAFIIIALFTVIFQQFGVNMIDYCLQLTSNHSIGDHTIDDINTISPSPTSHQVLPLPVTLQDNIPRFWYLFINLSLYLASFSPGTAAPLITTHSPSSLSIAAMYYVLTTNIWPLILSTLRTFIPIIIPVLLSMICSFLREKIYPNNQLQHACRHVRSQQVQLYEQYQQQQRQQQDRLYNEIREDVLLKQQQDLNADVHATRVVEMVASSSSPAMYGAADGNTSQTMVDQNTLQTSIAPILTTFSMPSGYLFPMQAFAMVQSPTFHPTMPSYGVDLFSLSSDDLQKMLINTDETLHHYPEIWASILDNHSSQVYIAKRFPSVIDCRFTPIVRLPHNDQITQLFAVQEPLFPLKPLDGIRTQPRVLKHLLDTLCIDMPERIIESEAGDVDKARERWYNIKKWRADNHINTMLQTPYPLFHQIRDLCGHFFHGWDKQGNLIYVDRPGVIDFTKLRALGIDDPRLERHFIHNCEYQWTFISPHPSAKITSILDLTNLGFFDIMSGPAMAFFKTVAKTLQLYYPVRSNRIIILNTPSWFSKLWKIVSPMLHERTRQKVIIIGSGTSKQEMGKQLEEFIDLDELPELYGGTCQRCKEEWAKNKADGKHQQMKPASVWSPCTQYHFIEQQYRSFVTLVNESGS